MSQLTLLDICLRLLCLGQLLFYLVWVVAQSFHKKQCSSERWLLCALLICCTGAVILTMYYRPPAIYALRPILLALTDGLPFVFWMYVTFSLIDVQPSIRRLTWLRIGGAIYLFAHLYFFIINEGKGILHDAVHGAAALAVLHVIYQSISTWRDDLVDSRRRRRAVFLVAACVILAMYVLSELSDIRFMRSEWGSLVGAVVMLGFSLAFGVFCFWESTPGEAIPNKANPIDTGAANLEKIPYQYQALYQRLNAFIDMAGFTEPNLTLTRLAQRLDSKEHRLRCLINQYLGYRNFSTYLNSQRLPLACDWLQNKPQLSITDIALELGYGSITSFNRAFKSQYQQSPRDYRVATAPT